MKQKRWWKIKNKKNLTSNFEVRFFLIVKYYKTSSEILL